MITEFPQAHPQCSEAQMDDQLYIGVQGIFKGERRMGLVKTCGEKLQLLYSLSVFCLCKRNSEL